MFYKFLVQHALGRKFCDAISDCVAEIVEVTVCRTGDFFILVTRQLERHLVRVRQRKLLANLL